MVSTAELALAISEVPPFQIASHPAFDGGRTDRTQ